MHSSLIMPILASTACRLRTAMSRLCSLMAFSPATASAHIHSRRSDACSPTQHCSAVLKPFLMTSLDHDCHVRRNQQISCLGRPLPRSAGTDLLGIPRMGIMSLLSSSSWHGTTTSIFQLGVQGVLSIKSRPGPAANG